MLMLFCVTYLATVTSGGKLHCGSWWRELIAVEACSGTCCIMKRAGIVYPPRICTWWLFSATSHLLKLSQISISCQQAGDHVFKHMSLWRHFGLKQIALSWSEVTESKSPIPDDPSRSSFLISLVIWNPFFTFLTHTLSLG